jgi:hypothetical protein
MRVRIFSFLAGIVLLAGLVSAQTKNSNAAAKARPTMFGRNLLKNGNVEADTDDSKKVPGWVAADGLAQAKYGSVSGEWDWGLSGCGACGDYYLRLAFEGGVHELSTSQTVDLTPAAADIDQGKVTAGISAYLGGFLNSDTTSVVAASFQDASGRELGTLSTDPVDLSKLEKAPKGSASLTQVEKSGAIPGQTRKIVFTWHASATGSSADYLALGDNFSLVLTAQ